MTPLQVLHLATGNLYGGVEVFLRTLARRGPAAGLVQTVTVCWEGRLAGELRSAGAAVPSLGEVRFSRPWQVLRARARLRRVLRGTRFEVVVAHSAWTQALFGPLVRRAGLPLVLFLHNDIPRASRLERWARRVRPAAILANSDFTLASAADWYPAEIPRAVVHLPVEAAGPAGAGAGVRATTRASLGAAPDDCVILQASRLQAWKGAPTLLAALAGLRDRPGWTCWIAGGAQRAGEEAFAAELRAQVASLGLAERVQFLGQRADVPALLAAADIYCQVNAQPEPFGIVFVEAMQAGLPVLAAASGGVAEIVTPECGALIPPGPGPEVAAAVTSRLRRWIDSPELRRAAGEAGRARAADMCDPDRQVARLADHLRRIAGR